MMDWTPRRKSLAFTSTVVVAALLLVGGALASAEGLLGPVRDGRDWWQERALTHHTSALAVLVGEVTPDGVRPLSGIDVVAERLPVFATFADVEAGGADAVPTLVARGSTGDDGRLVLHLASSDRALALYRILVVGQGWSSSHDWHLDGDMRARVLVPAEGEAAWRWIPHRDVEAGEAAPRLAVHLYDRRHCELSADGLPTTCAVPPGEGAIVTVHAVVEGMRGEERARGATVDEGSFALPEGPYDVVVAYEGREVALRLVMACDWALVVHFDGERLFFQEEPPCAGSRPQPT